MYKLLLATDDPAILAAFGEVPSWENLGFKPPRIVSSANEAIEKLEKHHIDGIAFSLSANEENRLMAELMEHYPILPIFNAGKNATAVNESLIELRSLLSRMYADFSNDDFGAYDMLQMCRHDFLRSLLSGKVTTEAYVKNHLRLLRSKMDPTKPCVIVDMQLPGDDTFLSERWHYGNERLEVAIRNFFGAELNGMRMMPAVLPDSTIRLLCCPMLGCSVDQDSITATVTAHVEESIGMVSDYLGLSLTISNIAVLPLITALAKESK